MEKQRGTKTIAVLALIVAVVGLTIGFAAYTRSLDITDIEGTVTPGEMELDVFFDNDQTKDNELTVVKGTGTAAIADESGAVITNSVVNSGTNPTISGLRANFTQKGQSVVYTFYVYNNSPYSIYLNELSFLDESTYKTCTAIDPTNTNATLVQNACEDITLSLVIGGVTVLSTGDATPVTHSLGPGRWKDVQVKIAYDGLDYPLPDGPMKVTFSGIRIGYATIKPY